MSVLNQMLRDLEKRGAMPDLVAAAGTATVARPALPMSERKFSSRRYWIWAGVLAVAAMFVGIHTWLNYRVQEASAARAPLGARQFGSVVAPETPAPAAPAAQVAPAVVAEPAPPILQSPLAPPPAEAPKAKPVVAQSPRSSGPVRAKPAASATPIAAVERPATTEAPAQPSVVARSTSDVARDVDRAAELIARGRSTEAMELLVQVLNRQPTHVAARSSLAALLAEAGRREQALHVLLAGTEVDAARFAMPTAQLQAEMGDLNGAQQTLARVPPARRNAGYEALNAGLAQRAGDHMTAIAAYRRALAQVQPEAVWWVGLGVSLEATGEAAEARNAYLRATAEAKLPADVRRYATERVAALEAQGQEARRASMAHIF